MGHGPSLIAPRIWAQFIPAIASGNFTNSAAARDILRQSLRQAESCLGFAALVVAAQSPEGRTLRRIRRAVSEGMRGLN